MDDWPIKDTAAGKASADDATSSAALTSGERRKGRGGVVTSGTSLSLERPVWAEDPVRGLPA